jgi:hypothetical protein
MLTGGNIEWPQEFGDEQSFGLFCDDDGGLSSGG